MDNRTTRSQEIRMSKTIDERKSDLLKKLESIKGKQITDTEFIFPARNGQLFLIDTKLSKKVNGIVNGEFITTYMWDDALNLCVGMYYGSSYENERVLFFLVEGNNGLTAHHSPEGKGLATFADYEKYAEAKFV